MHALDARASARIQKCSIYAADRNSLATCGSIFSWRGDDAQVLPECPRVVAAGAGLRARQQTTVCGSLCFWRGWKTKSINVNGHRLVHTRAFRPFSFRPVLPDQSFAGSLIFRFTRRRPAHFRAIASPEARRATPTSHRAQARRQPIPWMSSRGPLQSPSRQARDPVHSQR